MDRKVVFIGGADFSGTTMLDLTLGTLTGCRSLGEVNSFFRPRVKEQMKVTCSCGELCDFWRNAAERGEREFYSHVFADHSDLRVLIDSSKSVPWINEQTTRLSQRGYTVKHLLIWKDVAEFRLSREKRGRGKGWAKSWIRYHRAYLAQPREFYSVRLSSLLSNFDHIASEICEWIGVAYEPGIREYWRREHHIVFGSATARLRLHPKGSVVHAKTLESSRRRDLNPSSSRRTFGTSDPTPRQADDMNSILSLLEHDGPKKLLVPIRSARKDLYFYQLRSLIEKRILPLWFGDRRHLVRSQL